ncbi:MAG: FAD-dependent oxidoreductase [Coriobacteriia bacterium]
MEKLSRRDFVKGVAAAGVATAAAGMMTACSNKAEAEQTWDRETDVLIVGTGFAGLSAAITAADAGASVLVIEKMPEKYAGGNSRVCGQLAWVPLTVEKGIAYFKQMATERHLLDLPDATIKAYITEMAKNTDFLTKTCGVETMQSPMGAKEVHAAPDADAAAYTVVSKTNIGGNAVWTAVANTAKSRKVEFAYETAATKILTDGSGQVIGVKATAGGSTIAIKAKKGVVLCLGSFEFDEAMKANYIEGPLWGWGTPGNTGDGIRMCQELGADFWHMNNAMGPIMYGIPVSVLGKDFAPDGADFANNSVVCSFSGKHHIWTDKYGKRFIDESREHQHGWGWKSILWDDSAMIELPRVPMWVVFDQTKMATEGGMTGTSGMKVGWVETHTDFTWTKDLSKEISKGWVVKGATVEELAANMKVDPAVLKATIDRYNAFASTGADTDFGRSAKTMAPLAGPFYAVQVWPIMVNTDGGAKRDEKARVLRVDGKPIPRLYSAGEFGSFWPHYYQGGGNISECMATGRIAATNAAHEAAWDADV